MTPERISILYFSPTGGTRRVARMLLSALRSSRIPLEEINLTPFEARRKRRTFGAGDLVFICVPSYYGRVALPMQNLDALSGEGALAVPVAVYGNREYDDTLRELSGILSGRGFVTTAAAAFIAQHSQCPELGEGRPDANDRARIEAFARDVLAKLASVAGDDLDGLAIKLLGDENAPLRPYLPTPAAPVLAHPERCRHCGECAAHCPQDIIDPLSFAVTEPEECILCRACMASCPEGARDLPEPVRSAVAQRMAAIRDANLARKEPSVFL